MSLCIVVFDQGQGSWDVGTGYLSCQVGRLVFSAYSASSSIASVAAITWCVRTDCVPGSWPARAISERHLANLSPSHAWVLAD